MIIKTVQCCTQDTQMNSSWRCTSVFWFGFSLGILCVFACFCLRFFGFYVFSPVCFEFSK